MYNGYQAGPESGEPFVPSVSVDALPNKVDWREKGYVTEIKNQVSGQCFYELYNFTRNLLDLGSVWFLLGLQHHWISGGTALQCNWETYLSLGTESHGLLSY